MYIWSKWKKTRPESPFLCVKPLPLKVCSGSDRRAIKGPQEAHSHTWLSHGHTEFAAAHGGLQLAVLSGSRAGRSPLLSYQLEEAGLQSASRPTASSSDRELERGGPEKAVPVADRGRVCATGRGETRSS